MASKVKILVVDDELAVLESFKMILGLKDYTVKTAQNMEEAVIAVENEKFSMAFVDLRFNGEDIGLDILAKIKEIEPGLEVVICTAYATNQNKIDAKKRGAMDYISKPFMMEDVFGLVDRALGSGKK
ncbi:MAG: response regulator [Candidatus Margulisbacteria bacterium]|nr:response regulator [Candidatus Margulisiibacteriota bacterium]MBU1022025.1 response regulator [Candidatus Margulisiibacteriota bacterium]MBU1729620.1 response regulator [Candidatus Margulisiibacteriota bacterium]MBU1954940.1 response regulator [Candidatus Margulisiibacteriota bacterium]